MKQTQWFCSRYVDFMAGTIVLCFHPGGGKNFIDVLDAQWECEGELVPLDPSILNPREFLVYQHGLFLMQMLQNMNLVGAKASLF